tara:strand:+ start:84 stop:293 length:210 start_codon:yes stop_codon:yes gene_type:complete
MKILKDIISIILLFILCGAIGGYYNAKEKGKPYNIVKEGAKSTKQTIDYIVEGWNEANEEVEADTTSTP